MVKYKPSIFIIIGKESKSDVPSTCLWLSKTGIKKPMVASVSFDLHTVPTTKIGMLIFVN